MAKRQATVRRETTETDVTVSIDIDGTGQSEIASGHKMFDHLLSQVAKHGLIDLKVTASGNNQHHVIEDVGIVMGRALRQALGERAGIVRMAHAIVPMDDAVATVALDIGGRGYLSIESEFSRPHVDELEVDLIRHYLDSFAKEALLNLHIEVKKGVNDHHKAEAVFKALGRALKDALALEPRLGGSVPSTKEVIES